MEKTGAGPFRDIAEAGLNRIVNRRPLYLTLAAAGLTVLATLVVIGAPTVASCASDARGVVDCVRDKINRKFNLTGPSDDGLRPSFDTPTPVAPPSAPPSAAPVAKPVAEPIATPVAEPMSKFSVSIVESADASEPPAPTVRSADLSPEIAPVPRPDPVPVAQPAPPPAEPVGAPVISATPASVAPAPRLPEGWPIYTEAPSPPLPAASLADAPIEPSTSAVLPETPLALPKTIATQASAPPPALAPAPPLLPPELPLQMAAATPVAPPATPEVTSLPVLAPTIDAIQIEGDSNFVAGTGPEGTRVRLYINDRLIDDSEVIEGRWLIEGINLLDSPSSILRIEAFDPATGEVLGTASVSVEIDLPADAEPIAPPDPVPSTPAPAAPAPIAPLSVVPAAPVVAPEPAVDQQAEAIPALPPSPPIPASRSAKAPTAAPTMIPKLTPITPRKSSASVSVLPLPKADAYPTLRRSGPAAPSVQTLN